MGRAVPATADSGCVLAPGAAAADSTRGETGVPLSETTGEPVGVAREAGVVPVADEVRKVHAHLCLPALVAQAGTDRVMMGDRGDRLPLAIGGSAPGHG